MTHYSSILVDEMVLPEKGANWQATQYDLTLMALTGGIERTEKEWKSLLDRAGLQILHIYPYTAPRRDSVIHAVPKQPALGPSR